MAAQQYSPEPQRFISVAEYLEFDAKSDVRHEYLDGQVTSMAGATTAHNTITFNLSAGLGSQLRGSSCRGFSSDQRVRVPGTRLYAYPDVVVVCGEVQIDDQGPGETLLNPTVLIEVLSLSTEHHDRTEKWLRYQRLASLRDYLLVAQHAPIIEHYARQQDGAWSYSTHQGLEGLEAAFELCGAPATVRLAEVYENIVFGRHGDFNHGDFNHGEPN